MRQYELMMIIDPSLSEADREELLREVEAELNTDNSKIIETDHLGERDLAYRIQRSDTGYYILYTIEKSSGDFIRATNTFNIKTSIWRHMFVRLDT